MGATVSGLFERMFKSKEMRILMLGLDAAGKTSKTRIHYNLYCQTNQYFYTDSIGQLFYIN